MDTKKFADTFEKISARYAKTFNFERDDDWFVLKLQEEVGELTQSYLMYRGKARMKGKNAQEIRKDFEGEVGDVLTHLLLVAHRFHVDLDAVITRKLTEWQKRNV